MKNLKTIVSVWVIFLNKLGINSVPEENKLLTPQEVNSRVIWHMHIKSIWLFVIAILIYFKIPQKVNDLLTNMITDIKKHFSKYGAIR